MAKIRGQQVLMRNLQAAGEAPTKIIDGVLASALQPIADQANATAPRPSLRGGAVVRRMKSRGRYYRQFWVAFRRGMPMRIAHLVELGTAPHSLAKGASRRYGIMQDVPPFHPGTPPEPFFRPAFEAKKEITIRAAASGIWAAISSTVRGLGVR